MSRSIAVRLIVSFVLVSAATGIMAVTASAQTLVSAKAGLINDVNGPVFVNDGISSKPAQVGYQMEREFRLRTESDGRAELLLNPGSYLRVSADTDLSVLENAPDQMQVGLDRGTIIVEAGSFLPDEVELEVVTSAGSIRLMKNGIYRIEASEDGRASLKVFEGEALVPSATAQLERCKKGRVAILGPDAGQLALSRFDTRQQDGFDRWSASRASTLLAANTALANATNPSSIRLLTYSGYGSPFGYSGWNSGFWGWSSANSCYTYFPAPWSSGFRSPYGWSYGNCGCNSWFYPFYNRYAGSYSPGYGIIASGGENGGRGNRPYYGPGGRGERRGARDTGPVYGVGGRGDHRGAREAGPTYGAGGRGDHRGARGEGSGGGRVHSGGGGGSHSQPSAPSHSASGGGHGGGGGGAAHGGRGGNKGNE